MPEEVDGAESRDGYLEQGAAQDVQELAEDQEEDMPGLVDDQIDSVDEAEEDSRAEEVEAARRDLPAQAGEREEPEGAAGHGSQSDDAQPNRPSARTQPARRHRGTRCPSPDAIRNSRIARAGITMVSPATGSWRTRSDLSGADI